ncbi:MAG TPA: GFA family protein [Burkholderiaceae bacterium]|jgi:hypothetical protein
MKVHGSCHCGQISYEAEVDPATVSLCNCTDCQVLAGSAFRVSVPAPAATFRLLSGTPKVYLKTAQSGNKRRHSFCPNCGAPIAATADIDDPTSYMLRVGGLDQRAQLPPTVRKWCRSELVWAQDVSGIPGIEGG